MTTVADDRIPSRCWTSNVGAPRAMREMVIAYQDTALALAIAIGRNVGNFPTLALRPLSQIQDRRSAPGLASKAWLRPPVATHLVSLLF
jgi:hypothetical protein